MIKDFIIYSLKDIKRNKKNVILIIIISLLLLLLYIDVTFYKNFNDYLDSATNKNIGFRTLSIYNGARSEEESLKKLKNTNHIVEMYRSRYDSFALDTDLTNTGLDGRIGLLYGTENITPSSIVGKSMKDLNSGELICPYTFYPSSDSDLKTDENKMFSPEDTLNREFNATYYIYNIEINDNEVADELTSDTKKFKIVGLYDSTLVMNSNNNCYATPEDIKELSDFLNPPLEDLSTYTNLYVVIDEVKNVSSVKKELQKMGFEVSAETNASIDKNVLTIITILCTSFFIIIIATFSYVFINYMKKNIIRESKYLGILRACGYIKKDIISKQIVNNLIILFFSFIISILVFSISFIILDKNIFKYFKYIGIKINSNISLLIILSIIVTLAMIIIVSLLTKNVLNQEINNLLKEE